MSKQIYVDPSDNAGALALDYVLGHNGNQNANAIKGYIAQLHGTPDEMMLGLSRHLIAEDQKGDKVQVEAVKDTMAYLTMKTRMEAAQKNHVNEVNDTDYYFVRQKGINKGHDLRMSDDRAKATAARAAHDQQVANEAAAKAQAEAAAAAKAKKDYENLSPRDMAIVDVVTEPNDRAGVRAALEHARGKDASGKPREIAEEMRVNLKNSLSDKGSAFSWFGLSQHDPRELALKVLDRQHAIEQERAQQAQAPAQPAKPAPATPPVDPKHAADPKHPAAKPPVDPKHAVDPKHPVTPPVTTATPPVDPKHPAAKTPAATPPATTPADHPKPVVHHHHATHIDKSIQFDLEALGLHTRRNDNFDASKGADAMDGWNGTVTGGSIKKFLEDNKLATFDDAAKAKLHELATRAVSAQTTPVTGGQGASSAGSPAATPAGAALAPGVQRT